MFLQDMFAHGFRRLQNSAMRDGAAEWRRQCCHRRHILGPLPGGGTGDDASKAMTDEMDFPLSLKKCFLDTGIETLLDQDIRALGIDADAGEVRPVSDAPEPGVELRKIRVGPQESGN